jgi:tetratricopeptide (TPR) repeat protein
MTSARRTLLVAVLVLVGCPTPRPGPARAPAFDPAAARRALEADLARLEASPLASPAALRAAHRDLGWLCLASLGDRPAARKHLGLATRIAGPRAEPWAWYGLAVDADTLLDVENAAAAYLRVLGDAAALQRAPDPEARPPAGIGLADLATVAALRLIDLAPHLDPGTSARLEATLAGPLPPRARVALALWAVDRARRSGDRARLAAAERRAGCPTAIHLGPRAGRFPRLILAGRIPVEASTGPVDTLPVRACRVLVRSPDGRPGVRQVALPVPGSPTGRARLEIAWPGPLAWSTGSAPFQPVDAPDAPSPVVRSLVVPALALGRDVRLRLPVDALPRRLVVALTDEQGRGLGADAAAPAWPETLALPGAAPEALPAYRPLRDLLGVALALQDGAPDAARPAADRLGPSAPRFAWGQALLARLDQRDEALGRAAGLDRARERLARALAADPAAMALRLRLASLLRRRQRSPDALRLLDDAPAPALGAIPLLRRALVRLYQDQGFGAVAVREAQRSTEERPGSADAWSLRHALALDEGDAATVALAAERIAGLDASSLVLAQVRAQQGRHAEAVALATAAAERRDDDAPLELIAASRRALGQLAGAEAAQRELLRAAPADPERRLALADLLVRRGRVDAARDLLRAGVAANPGHRDLIHALEALGEPHPLAAFRVDGAAVIAAYRRAPRWPGAGVPVYLLDRSVTRAWPGGGLLTLTHQIVEVTHAEAVARFAELRLPGGARIFTLRTIKPDGTTREPEDVGDPERVHLPDVAVGDLVEVEIATARAPEPTWDQGFFGGSFSFRSVAAHFLRSELVVVAPPEVPLRFTPLGAVPPAREHRAAGLRVVTFTAEQVDRLRTEPFTPTLLGDLPTVVFGAGVDLADLLRQRWEQRQVTDVATHAVRALAADRCRAADPPLERVRRAFAWVQEQVKETDPEARAAVTLATGAGGRLPLLRAVLARCQVGAVETLLVRPRQLDLPETPVPLLPAYSEQVLRVRLASGETLHLLPQLAQAPPGYLPPLLAGATARVVEQPGARPVRTPDPPGAEAREVSLSLHLRDDGSGVVAGEERLHGAAAVQLREAHAGVPEARLRQELEQRYFAWNLPGATLTALSFARVTPRTLPLGLRYRLSLPLATHREGDVHTVRAVLFPTRLGRGHARLATRRLPLQVGPLGPVRVVLDVHLPAGHEVRSLPAPAARQLGAGRFSLVAERRPHGARITVEVHLPFRVVSPVDYAAFAAFAAELDRAEAQVLTFRKR